jgi:hypothetical protein
MLSNWLRQASMSTTWHCQFWKYSSLPVAPTMEIINSHHVFWRKTWTKPCSSFRTWAELTPTSSW